MAKISWRALGLAAAALVAVAAASLGLQDGSDASKFVFDERSAGPTPTGDPQAADLAHCRAQSDPGDLSCQRVWEARRRQFFERSSAPEAVDLQPYGDGDANALAPLGTDEN
jgi:conjugative transfer region protein TrbK